MYVYQGYSSLSILVLYESVILSALTGNITWLAYILALSLEFEKAQTYRTFLYIRLYINEWMGLIRTTNKDNLRERNCKHVQISSLYETTP